MGRQHTLEILRIVETEPPYRAAGATYTVYEWKVVGCLDGNPAQYELLVKTLSSKPQCQACEGWKGVVEEDEFKGTIKYKIPTPKSAAFAGADAARQGPAQPGVPPGAQPVAQPVAQTAQPAAGPVGRPVMPQQRQLVAQPIGANAYTIEELENLYAYCWNFIAGLLQTKDLQASAAATATFFIAAQREHLKIPLAEESGQAGTGGEEQGSGTDVDETGMPF